MKLTVTALTLAATLFAGSASAFDPNDLQKLKDTNECFKCDLSGASLPLANLKGANFLRADIRSAEMKEAIICNTTMPNSSVSDNGC